MYKPRNMNRMRPKPKLYGLQSMLWGLRSIKKLEAKIHYRRYSDRIDWGWYKRKSAKRVN